MTSGTLLNGREYGRRHALSTLGLTVAALFLVTVPCFSSDPVDAGFRYLAEKQHDSGLWSVDSERIQVDTIAAVRTLRRMGHEKGDAALTHAYTAFAAAAEAFEPVSTLDYTMLLVCVPETDPADLLALQNSDGGWGTAPGKRTDIVHTTIAAETLLALDTAPDAGWDKTAELLVSLRHEDGYWYLSDEPSASRLELTARIIRVLTDMKSAGLSDATAVDRTVSNALTLVRAALQPDGSFSAAPASSEVSLTDTAEAYRTLVRYDQPGLYAATRSLLESSQAADGGWSEPLRPGQEVYTTAIVLDAFFAVPSPVLSLRSDLYLGATSLSFAPQQPSVGDSVTLSAMVFNLGEAAAEGFDVAFYVGDPRSGGELIGAPTEISSLAPKGSALATVELDTTGITSAPEIYTWVDPANDAAETNITNNIAHKGLSIHGLPDAGVIQGTDLYISPKMITYNHEATGSVFLAGSPAVLLGVTVSNLGNEASSGFSIEVTDGTSPVARTAIDGLPAGASETVEFPWLPASGTHTLIASADTEDTVAEADETNNTAESVLSVVGATCSVTVKKYVDGSELDPPFTAYETGRFIVASAYQDAFVRLSVTEPEGETAPYPPQPLHEAGRYQWNTINRAPGDYEVTATFRNNETRAVVDTASAEFRIESSVGLRSVRASIPKDIIQGGQIEPIPVEAELSNGSNVDSEWSLSWKVFDPSGSEVASSASAQTVTLPGSQMSKLVALDDSITGVLTTEGPYRVVVTAANTDAGSVQDSTTFNLLPPLHLNVINRAVPDEISPLGRARVRTVFQLSATGEATGLGTPVAIRSISSDADGNVTDSDTSVVTLEASGIINALGEIVPDGALLAVYAPYGTLTGGTTPVGDPPNPQIRVFEIADGSVTFEYSPLGTALNAGQHSIAVLQFHQYFPDASGTEWFGKNIGNTEVQLAGE